MKATLLETKVPATGRPIITDAATRVIQMTVEGIG